jgi:hypothetical protein
MANRSTFPLVDALFDGKLEERLREWRSAKVSHEEIARLIHEEKGAAPTLSTIRRFCIDLGIDNQPQDAA